MHDAPQANIVNPAVAINCNLYVAFPIIGSTHLNFYNTAISINDALKPVGGDSIAVDIDNVVSNLNGLDVMASEAHLTLLAGGWRRDDTYYTFSVTEKMNTFTMIPKEPTVLAWEGNTNYLDQAVDLSGYRFNLLHAREYSFGISDKISDNFRFGGRVSLLFGKSNVQTKNVEGTFYTDSRSFESRLDLNARINSSLPIDVSVDTVGNVNGISLKDDFSPMAYLLNGKNIGVGLDVGFIYQVNDALQLSGSILNLGMIRWKSEVNNFTSSGSIDFVGSGNTNDLDTENYVTVWMDSVLNVFGLKPGEDAYFSTLAPEVYMGATYSFSDRLNAGALVHSQMYKNKVHPSLTLSGNAVITKYLSGSISYTLQNNEFDNIGAGLSLRLGTLHLHAMADNVPGLIRFEDAQNVNVRFGISLLFGCANKIFNSRDCNCVGDPYGENRSNVRPRRRR